MLFQRKKKEELWRYASENHASAAGGMTSQPPQPHRHQHQRLPHLQHCHNHQRQQQPHPYHHNHQQSTQSFGNCCATMSNSSSTQLNNTPPPPYSSVPYGIDCSGVYAAIQSSPDYRSAVRQPLNYATDTETETSVSATESETSCVRMRHGFEHPDDSSKSGYNYGNYGDDMLVDEFEQSNDSNNSSNRSYRLAAKLQKHEQESPSPSRRRQTSTTTTTTAVATTTTTTFASTAANMFRNCCGGGFFTESSTGGTTTNNNNNQSNNNSKNHYEPQTPTSATATRSPNTVLTHQKYFCALMKKLKVSQIDTLLQAVQSRSDAKSSVPRGSAAHQPHCILISRSPILDEEPYVIACRLFFWPDLKYASELKRLPVCPNERDPVYVCCNPLHWCRILETETAPPPYQRPNMERLKTEDPALRVTSLNEGNSSTASTVSISSSSNNNNKACVRIPESLTTDGEEDRRSGWCQVAYWEMAQRVGARYLAKKSSINIYSEGPCSGGISDEMCLKDLAEKKPTPSPGDVQYTRQKIGLGVTLSQEADGVWLYNRSTVPIFLYSPTLSESCFRVCRVMPGDCLRAFDSHRAHSLTYPSQFPGAQTGPVDTFSIRISFAKGWGCAYKRQDITRCPCWLEVLFAQR